MTAFDTGTLSWVRDEIDLALERAGDALARHAAAPDEKPALAEARGHLHQASGALAIVGLAGVTQCAEAVEARLAELAEPDHGRDVVAVAAAAGAALAALRRYLDDLMAGHPDQPLRLYPTHRALALAAGLPAPEPLALFRPDLTLRPPRRDPAPPPPAPARLKALRLGFARGLAKWRAGETRGRVEMKNAIAAVEQTRGRPGERALWWVALAWFDATETPADAALDGLDRALAALADGQTETDDALMTALLYDIAVAPPGDELLESVRACYRLAELIPAAGLAIETRREACRAPLTTAMAEWERFAQGAAIALMRFHDVALLLAATARDSNDAELARLAAAIADFAAWLRQRPERADAALTMEVASALVLVEDAIEREGARAPAAEPLFAAEVDAQLGRLDALRGGEAPPPPQPRRWREQLLVAQVAAEIRVNLDAAEPLLDEHFSRGGALPPQVAERLHQVAGAFALLGEETAARVAGAVEARLAAPETGVGIAVAERLAALGQFAAALAHGQPARDLLAPLDEATAVPPEPTFAAPATSAPAAGGDAELLAIFTEEAHEVLAALAAAQPALTANPADREALTAIRRGFHTLKGSGRMVGLDALGAAAFAVERLLNRRLDERAPADADLQALIDAARDLFARWTAAIEAGQAPPDAAALLARCAELEGSVPSAPAAETAPPAPALTLVKPESPPETVNIGELKISPTLFNLYIEEAGGHVATLRGELGGPAGVPSRELIRAAHTLAGISAGTGFPAVQALAHALENALVRHSLARATPGEDARMLLARAVGALEGMVGAIAERRAPANEADLAARLETLTPEVPEAQKAPAPAISPLAERRQSRPADEIDPQLAALFLEEADEQLRQLDADLSAWRAAPTQTDIGRRMARLLHTFKGGARMCGAMGIGELAHSMETRIEQALAEGGAAATVLDGLDVSLGRANHLVAELRRPAAAAPTAAPVVAAPTAAAPSGEAGPAVLLRVRADLIDRLVNEAGELAIARGRIEGSVKGVKGALIDLTENVARLRGQLREFEIIAETSMQSRLGTSEARGRDFDPLEFDRFTRLQELTRMMAESVNDVAAVQHALQRQTEIAGEALAAQTRQNRELSHALLRARMVPFATVAERLHRVVRQTAKELGRQANLDIQGGDTPVDRNVLERMLGPLEHLLRNAVAHGIEPPEARAAAGKPALGQIVLSIAPSDNDIALTLADDGAGLDHAAIRRRAIERGLIASTDAVDDEALAELIFRPGFSTAATVSEIAGRGVGLDVVRDAVAQLGGRVTVTAQAGAGTRFAIVLPLTLAVVSVMLVGAAGQTWAIPTAMVEEARELDADETAARRVAGSVTRNGRHYLWHDLARLFGRAPTATPTAWQLLLQNGGEQIALEVETLTQNQEVVVKPVGDQLARVPGLIGATVLPDGAVALIVNPVALALRVAAAATATTLFRPADAVPPAPTFAATAARAPTVMVVDDSLTVRKITGRLLERAGYRLMTAKDGVDALEQLARQRPDAILADIEMPRMDGFELVRALSADAELAGIPVIMITSRIADKHRQVAQELGVKNYLGKPYDEDALLALLAELTGKA
jgi:chemosensory pili system protein ChpA (sensor histidine kinase/response regulator)